MFLGVVIRESGLTHFYDLFSNTVLYGATFFLGLLLGVLCEANTILNPTVLILLVLGMTALLFSAIGGPLGGYVLYFASGRKYNPTIGIAAVSCVPTTAKVAQKEVAAVNPGGDRPAARARRQRLRRDHHGRVRGGARHLASLALTAAMSCRVSSERLPRAAGGRRGSRVHRRHGGAAARRARLR